MERTAGNDVITALPLTEEVRQVRGILFRSHQVWFFVDIMRVREIITATELGTLAGMPPTVSGVVRYRGSVVPVLDLRERFGLPAGGGVCRSLVLVLVLPDRLLGLLVDEVTEVLTLSVDTIQPPPSLISSRFAPFFIGVAGAGDRFVLLVNIDRLLTDEEQSAIDWQVRQGRAGGAPTVVVCPRCAARFRASGIRPGRAEEMFRCTSCRSLFRIALTEFEAHRE